jgi:hypothetical protein
MSKNATPGEVFQDDRPILSTSGPDLGHVASRILGSFLEGQGFVASVAEQVRAEFRRGDLILQLSYYTEDPSPRGLNVGLGFVYPDGATETVGLWALDPAGANRTFETERFADGTELTRLIEGLRDAALRDWVAEYWRRPDRLAAALQVAATEREEQHQAAVGERLLREARSAFAAGKFQEAVDRYAMAGSELSAVDDQRLKLARRSLDAD